MWNTHTENEFASCSKDYILNLVDGETGICYKIRVDQQTYERSQDGKIVE